jgi:hypothetical protein
MKENFLHYLWKLGQFDFKDLKTVSGEPISLLHRGFHNHHDGPDFNDARITLNGIEWAGKIEIHVRSRDWNDHGHQFDKTYNNVILHVVYNYNGDIQCENGVSPPTLELKDRIDMEQYAHYLELIESGQSIPCENQISSVPDARISLWLENMMVERIEQKISSYPIILEEYKNDFNRLFFHAITKSYGQKQNAESMVSWWKSTPFSALNKTKNNLFELESLVFGQSGLLEKRKIGLENEIEGGEVYLKNLQSEYHYLTKKWDLKPIHNIAWVFMRLRPASFPTLRLAQWCSMFQSSEGLWELVLQEEDPRALWPYFAVSPSPYWQKHFHFMDDGKNLLGIPGKDFVESVLINGVIPMLYFYGKYTNQDRYTEKAMDWLQNLPAEKNYILDKWKSMGVMNKDAGSSQALLHLKSRYCDSKRCLECHIGCHLLSKEMKMKDSIVSEPYETMRSA